MISARYALLLASLMFLPACSAQKVVSCPEPVALERPERPVRQEGEKVSLYYVRVLKYLESLEAVVDEHNKHLMER